MGEDKTIDLPIFWFLKMGEDKTVCLPHFRFLKMGEVGGGQQTLIPSGFGANPCQI
jgi:hypothetical protein